MKYTVSTLMGLLALASQASPAHAGAVTSFSDRQVFNKTVAAPTTVENFTDGHHFPISTGILNSETNLNVESGKPIRPGDIKPGVTYSTAIGVGYFLNIDRSSYSDGGFLDGMKQPNGNPLAVTFDKPVNAFGFDTNLYMGRQFDLKISFTEGQDKILSFQTQPTFEKFFFYGFVSDRRDIASLVIESRGSSDGSFSFALDNFTFSPPVPEPATSALMLVGVLALGGLVRRSQASGRHAPQR